MVEKAWADSAHQVQTGGLAGRLSLVHENLHKWDRLVLKKPQNKIKQVKREFEEITRAELSKENIRREKELAEELKKLLEQEELYLAQRSRINWLKFGDQNTGFFPSFRFQPQSEEQNKFFKECQWEFDRRDGSTQPFGFRLLCRSIDYGGG
jgi:hypothetical protein